MGNTFVKTGHAPEPIGPYNQAVLAGNTLYVSGQIAINPESGKLEQVNIFVETCRVLQNVEAILKEAGMGFENVVKSTIFILDMNDFAKVNEVYAEYFKNNHPARETVEVSALPKGVRVEISVIAVKG